MKTKIEVSKKIMETEEEVEAFDKILSTDKTLPEAVVRTLTLIKIRAQAQIDALEWVLK